MVSFRIKGLNMVVDGEIEIRAATMLDLPQVQSIFNYYVTTSVMTFQINPVEPTYFFAKLDEAKTLGLPYLVAIEPLHNDHCNGERKGAGEELAKVLGYTYASGFRNFKEGYKHTVEITIFIHPDFQSQGIGSRLLVALLNALHHVSIPADTFRPRVKEIIACMAIDTETKDGKRGEGLREWYEKRGFREVGRMANVGWKFERWLGVVFLQLSLRNGEEMRGLGINAGEEILSRQVLGNHQFSLE
jgi:L-amino acid N-acyltransferase YncA